MRSVTYSMGVSLDRYIVGPDGGFDWTAPDEEVFRFSPPRAAGGSRTRRDPHLQLESRLPPLPRGALVGEALDQLVARAVAIAGEHHPAIRSPRWPRALSRTGTRPGIRPAWWSSSARWVPARS